MDGMDVDDELESIEKMSVGYRWNKCYGDKRPSEYVAHKSNRM